MIKKIVQHIITGIMIGSFFYLVVALTQGVDVVISPRNIIINWVMSGLIGLVSYIFSSKNYFTIKLFIHYLLVTIIVNTTASISHWIGHNLKGILELNGVIFIIYTLVWLILRILDIVAVREINQRIKKK